MKKFYTLLIAGAMAAGMAGCSSDSSSSSSNSTDNSGSEEKTEETNTNTSSGSEDVSVFYYTFGDAYISSVRAALDKDLKDAGINYQNYDSNNNQTTQTEQVQTAISKGTKCLVVNLVDSSSDDAASNIVKLAEDANIPVVFFNRSVSEEVITAYDKSAYIGTDYEQAGKMQGDMIGQYLIDNYDTVDLNGDGVISYVMFKGDEANAEAIARTKFGQENADVILEENGKPVLSFYDSANDKKYLVDQTGSWSSAAAADYMQTILSQFNPENKNMVELVIANNDEMAIGSISALQNAGYNKDGAEIVIPVFGVDATDAAVEKIKEGSMTGTIKQDAEGMAKAVCTIVQNLTEGKDKFDSIDADNIVGTWRVNIPYSTYSGE